MRCLTQSLTQVHQSALSKERAKAKADYSLLGPVIYSEYEPHSATYIYFYVSSIVCCLFVCKRPFSLTAILDGWPQIKVHTDERTQVHSAQCPLVVTHTSTNRGNLTSVNESPSYSIANPYFYFPMGSIL